MTTTAATRELRKHTGDSQQAFATRLGLSIRGIANYEGDREPTGRALAQLETLAAEQGREDLAEVFREALNKELGPGLISGDRPKNATEQLWVAALLAVLRNPQYARTRPKLRKLLEEPAARCIGISKAKRERWEKGESAKLLLQQGTAPAEVAAVLEVPVVEVERFWNWTRFLDAAREAGVLKEGK